MTEKPEHGPIVGLEHTRILDALDYPVLVIARTFRIVYMNAAARARYGVADLESQAVYCHSVLHRLPKPCDAAPGSCPVCAVFDGGGASRAIHEHRNASGTFVLEEVVTSALRGDDGEVAYVVESVRDAAGLLASKEVVERMRTELDLLRGILPTCAGCKRIRAADGRWEGIEAYVEKRSAAQFSHGMCPDCVERLYPEFQGGAEGEK